MKHSTENWQTGGFALYVHWPFCASKCPYCDFNSHVRQHVDQRAWRLAYLAEIDRLASETPGRILGSIFFGGGTPSLMEPGTVAAIIEAAKARWRPANDLEVTLEANPTSSEADRFAGYAAAGVNRLSLGLQALNDADLRRLGRRHSAAEGLAAWEMARRTFERTSCDLIYARQDQSLSAWQGELAELLRREPEHLSLYQLTIEGGTAFGALHARGRLRGLPGESLAADMYELTQELCDAAGLPLYEVSNHAVPGAESRHNLIYWRMGDYVGIGPGAHGRFTAGGRRLATSTLRSPEAWLTAVRKRGSGELPREGLSPPEQAFEYLMMALRLAEGLSLARYLSLGGALPPAGRLAALVGGGLITIEGDSLRCTMAGRLVLNALVVELAGDQPGASLPPAAESSRHSRSSSSKPL